MHLELPKLRLHTLADFIKHYLMIVLSILTALGLEAWIEHTHHDHAARLATTKIEAEIRVNWQRSIAYARMTWRARSCWKKPATRCWPTSRPDSRLRPSTATPTH
jgi:hypothetical protein